MALKGLLLSCLIHLLLLFGLWQSDWISPVTEPATAVADVPEAIFLARFQTTEPIVPQRPNASPEPIAAAAAVDMHNISAPAPAPAPAVVPLPKQMSAVVAPPVPESDSGPARVTQKKPVMRSEPARPATAVLPQAIAAESTAEAISTASARTSPRVAASPAPPVNSTPVLQRPGYAQRLTQRIEQHKSYPRRARERGLSGEVRFSVRVDDAGEMLAFHWLEGHQAFHHATLQAVRRALPYPPDPGQAPISIQVRMIYSLQDRM